MSVWVTKAFIRVVLRKNGCWMGRLSEKDGDGGFRVWKSCFFICSKVHAFLSNLSLYRSDAELGPARKFAVDSVLNAPGLTACRC